MLISVSLSGDGQRSGFRNPLPSGASLLRRLDGPATAQRGDRPTEYKDVVTGLFLLVYG